MRWQRLFREIEAQSIDEAAEERDSLAADLVDEQWAQTSWRGFLAGDVVLDVAGLGRLSGQVVSGTGAVIHVVDSGREVLIEPSAVTAVRSSGGRALPQTRQANWRQLLRALRDEGEVVRVTCRDGVSADGRLAAVGADFVQLASAERLVVVPWSAVSAVSTIR